MCLKTLMHLDGYLRIGCFEDGCSVHIFILSKFFLSNLIEKEVVSCDDAMTVRPSTTRAILWAIFRPPLEGFPPVEQASRMINPLGSICLK